MADIQLNNGYRCLVTGGTHKGKSGIIQDLHTSATGHLTLTLLQDNGLRFKTLGKNVSVICCTKSLQYSKVFALASLSKILVP